MAKKTNLESGFLFLYDWLPAFESLPAKEVKALLLALIARQRENAPLPPFKNPLTANYARMIEPCIKRRLDGALAAKREWGAGEHPPTGGGVDADVGKGAAPAPLKQSEAEISTEKKSTDISFAEQSEASAPKGGEYACARRVAGGATGRAETQKKNFYGYGRWGGRSDTARSGAKNTEGFPSSFDVDEFFEAALANTYGEKFGEH